ncbi:MAG: hypothetical protein IIT36_01225 [Aeriscardovia sp.]|nr:hypothetical protein [Aeriscardovia sp.]
MSEQHGNASAIDRASGRKWGYDVNQVDEFLAYARGKYSQTEPGLTQDEIQTATFDLQRSGYSIPQVDSALGRLEKAVVDKRTQWDVEHRGVRAWMADTRAAAETLRQRAEAHPGQRFTPAKKKQTAYDKRQVDQLIDDAWHRIVSATRLETSTNPQDVRDVEATEVSNAVFTQRTGDKGYREDSVDAYLNRMVQVLTRLESVKRLGIAVPWSEKPAPLTAASAMDSAVPSRKTSPAKDPLQSFESRAVKSSAKASLSEAANEPKNAVMPIVIPPAPQAIKEPLAPSQRLTSSFAQTAREEPQESTAEPVEHLSATTDASPTIDAPGAMDFSCGTPHASDSVEPTALTGSVAPSWSSDSGISHLFERAAGEADKPVSLTSLLAQSYDHEMPPSHPRHSLDSLTEEAAHSTADSTDSSSPDGRPSQTPQPTDPDQFFSRLMESNIMPTGTFDIPDLTFPGTNDDDFQK